MCSFNAGGASPARQPPVKNLGPTMISPHTVSNMYYLCLQQDVSARMEPHVQSVTANPFVTARKVSSVQDVKHVSQLQLFLCVSKTSQP